MARLELEIINFNKVLEKMTINGKNVKVVNKGNGVKTVVENINTDKAEVVIYEYHYYTSKHWFLWNLLCYFISVLGIFDIHHNKKFMVTDCRFTIDVQTDTIVRLNVNQFEDGGKLLNITSDAPFTETINKRYYDVDAKRKHKIMKRFKFWFTFVAIIATILLIVL